MTDESSVLIGHAHLNGRNLVMVANADSLCSQHIALTRTRHKHDAVVDTNRAMTVLSHSSRNC